MKLNHTIFNQLIKITGKVLKIDLRKFYIIKRLFKIIRRNICAKRY